MRKIESNFIHRLLLAINALLIFLLTFGIYIATLAPTVTCEDSGELITAGYYLGVPHPPGYPTWCILSHPFSYIPWGNVAWRFNLSSAFFASVTNLIIYLIVLEVTGRHHSIAIVSALLFGFSAEFWEQSVITEVYTLNALIIALSIFLLIKREHSRHKKWLLWMGITIGLGLGNHPTMFVIFPIFLFYILWESIRKNEGLIPLTITASTSVIVWVFTCLYLYLASKNNPPCDWGNPETIPNLIRHILRKQYQFMIFQYPRSITRTFTQLYLFYKMGCDQFGTPLIFLFAILGFLISLRKYSKLSLLFASICLAVGVTATLIQNFNFDREWLSVMSVFGIPIYMCYTIFIGMFIFYIYSKSGNKSVRILLRVAILGLPLITLIRNYDRNDYSNYWWGYEFGRNILNSLERNSIIIPYTDHTTFTILYLQEVEGIRKDVKLGIKYGYFNLEVFGNEKINMEKKFGEFPQSRYEPELIGWLIDNTDLPIYSEVEVKVKCKTKGRWAPAGIIFRFQREGENVYPSQAYWDKYRWNMDRSDVKDVASALIWLQIQWAKARDAYIIGDVEKARRLIGNGIEVYGEDDVILNNAGVLCAKYRDYETAKIYFEKGFRMNPHNIVLKNNLKKLEYLSVIPKGNLESK